MKRNLIVHGKLDGDHHDYFCTGFDKFVSTLLRSPFVIFFLICTFLYAGASAMYKRTDLHWHNMNEIPATSFDLGPDMDALSTAVAMHETANCTKGYGATHNNCHGLMYWPNGKRTAISFKSKDASHRHFKDVWARLYGDVPNRAMAKRYSGNDRSEAWYRNVTAFYEDLTKTNLKF